MDQQIRDKIQTIVINLGTNTGFIQRIKNELTAISEKLQQVLQSRATLQQMEARYKAQLEKATIDIQTAKNATLQINRQLQQSNATNATKLQEIQRQMQEEQRGAQQKIAAAEANVQKTQQAINELDLQLNQISQVVQTQSTLLNQANSSDQNNLFNHINGINKILQNILSGGPVSPGSGSGSGFGQIRQQQYPGGIIPNRVIESQMMNTSEYNNSPRVGGGKKMRKSRRTKKTMKKRRRNTKRYQKK